MVAQARVRGMGNFGETGVVAIVNARGFLSFTNEGERGCKLRFVEAERRVQVCFVMGGIHANHFEIVTQHISGRRAVESGEKETKKPKKLERRFIGKNASCGKRDTTISNKKMHRLACSDGGLKNEAIP